jgi:hypothetical protein
MCHLSVSTTPWSHMTCMEAKLHGLYSLALDKGHLHALSALPIISLYNPQSRVLSKKMMMMLTFGLCGQIPAYFRCPTALLVVAVHIHACEPHSFRPLYMIVGCKLFLLYPFYMQAIHYSAQKVMKHIFFSNDKTNECTMLTTFIMAYVTLPYTCFRTL